MSTVIMFIVLSIARVVVCGDEFIYNGFTGSNLLLDDLASVEKDGLLTLTDNRFINSQGHGFHPSPLIFYNDSDMSARSFCTTFVFTITAEQPGYSRDGLAFVISQTTNFSRATSGKYLGLVSPISDQSPEQFLAVELDTFADPDFKDIDDNHVGINIGSLTSKASASAGYYSFGAHGFPSFEGFEWLSLSSGDPMQLWIDYHAESMQLDITLAPVPMTKPSKPLLSWTIHLTALLRDPINYKYVGFSASTGYVWPATHRILAWSFKMNGDAQPLSYSMLPPKTSHQRSREKAIFVIILPVSLCIFASVTAVLLLRKRCKNAAGEEENWEAELGPRRFSRKDLHRATNGFSSTAQLGKGGFGCVYMGILPVSGTRIAVKRISSESKQGMTQFTAEIIILGRLRHRNLVRLLGYCQHKDELLLVYDYMPNGSLDRYLHGQSKRLLDWPQRFRIIRGVASGLLYLHEDWEQVIIHRDIKASNVLLDGETNGRLGDFGLARLHDHNADAHTTHVAGTRGYIAPELMRFGKATKTTDVFAFGAFILEVACGRRPIGLNARGELLVLVEWVRETWESGSIIDTMDPRLQGYAIEEAELVLKLGLLCSHPLPAARPGMRLVVKYLDGDFPLPEFSSSYISITDVDQVLETPPSVATTITSLSGGR